MVIKFEDINNNNRWGIAATSVIVHKKLHACMFDRIIITPSLYQSPCQEAASRIQLEIHVRSWLLCIICC